MYAPTLHKTLKNLFWVLLTNPYPRAHFIFSTGNKSTNSIYCFYPDFYNWNNSKFCERKIIYALRPTPVPSPEVINANSLVCSTHIFPVFQIYIPYFKIYAFFFYKNGILYRYLDNLLFLKNHNVHIPQDQKILTYSFRWVYFTLRMHRDLFI